MGSKSEQRSSGKSASRSIIFLKTKSKPDDAYEHYFCTTATRIWTPLFIHVLDHEFNKIVLRRLEDNITRGAFCQPSAQGVASSLESSKHYDGLIFTSQRAVEAFSSVVTYLQDDCARRGEDTSLSHLLPTSLPLYVVGPATARGLRALNLACNVLGEETGNADALASFILDNHNSARNLLFLVGEKRRDVIPTILSSDELGDRKFSIEEWVTYETTEAGSFPSDFRVAVEPLLGKGENHWVVVFSPTGCKAVLETLELVGKEWESDGRGRNIKIITIGPTTRDYLIDHFGFEPDACATRPSPEGIAQAIQDWEEANKTD